MQAKEFLNKIRYIDMMIDCKVEQLEDLRSRIISLGSPSFGDKVQSSLNPDKFTNTINNILELEKDIDNDIDKLVDLKREAREIIEKLDNDVEKLVLYKRYFDRKTFEQISVEMSYSWKHIHRLHSNALNDFDKLYKDVLECHIKNMI